MKKNNVIPSLQVRQTKRSLIVHLGKPSDSALAMCESMGIKSVGCSKAICRLSMSAGHYRKAMLAALDFAASKIITVHELHAIMARMSKEDIVEKIPDVFQNIDIREMLQTCGVWGLIGKDEVIDAIKKHRTAKDAADLTVRLIKAASYINTIQEHDAVYGTNTEGLLVEKPTLSDIESRERMFGIGEPEFYGSVNFFGFVGIDMLENCKPENRRELNPVMASYFAGYDVNSERMVTVMMGYDDKLHQDWRNLQWQLDDSAFEQNPVVSDPLVDAMSNEHTQQGWTSNYCRYLEAEGLGSSVVPMGVIAFDEEADEWMRQIARITKMYNEDAEGHDVIWTRSIAHMAQTMIGLFGVTGYSLIETFIMGYYLSPSIAYISQIDRESIDGAMRHMPFIADPIFNKVLIDKIRNDSAQRSAFIEAHRRAHDMSIDHAEYSKHLDIALGKLDVIVQHSEPVLHELSDETNLVMDKYSTEATIDFVKVLDQMMDLDKKTNDREK